MKNYLLGTLDVERRAQLEQRILSEPEFYEELLLTEEDLIDQYVAGSLSEPERQQFETNFLITPKRQNDLQFGRLLKRYVNSHPVLVELEQTPIAARYHEKTAPAKKSFPFYAPFGMRPALAFSLLTVAFAGILLLSLFASRRLTQRAVQTSAELAVVPLAPGSMRSRGADLKRFQVPPEGSYVKFELELTNPSFQNYRSELFHENRSLKTFDKLKVEANGERHVVPVTIPGELLNPGDYKVKLSGVLESGADEFVDNYSFRVIE